MTAVGKILVWLNLVFSLVVGGFVVFAYVARSQWVEQYGKLDKQYSVVKASAETYKSETERTKQEYQGRIDKVQTELKSAQEETRVAQTQIIQLNEDITKLKSTSQQESALTTKYGSEVEKRQNDVGTLREAIRKEQEVNNNLVKEKAELQNRETVAQIERRSVQEQNNRLVKQLEEMAKDMARMRANGGTRTAAVGDGKNPPPDHVEGLVRDTDASGLMTLTIGSDSGLVKGQTLELFRIDPSQPSRSKYLGTVRIVEAEAKQSVAQPMRHLTAPPQRGDHVASRILN